MPAILALLLVLAAAAALPASVSAQSGTAAGASRIEGSGRVIEDLRPLAPFSALVVTGPIDVRLKRAASEHALVRADDNIAPLVETRVAGGRLTIGLRAGASFRTRSRLAIEIGFRELASVRASGSGDVRVDRIEAPIVDVTIRGSGDVAIDLLEAEALAVAIAGSGDFSAAGRATRLGAVIAGSGDLRADRLEARQVAVRIRGSGDARVHATESLQADLAGSGDLRYRGAPALSKKVAGSGEVAPLR